MGCTPRSIHGLRALEHQHVQHVQRFRLQRITLLKTIDIDLGIGCAYPRIGIGGLGLGFDGLERLLG